MKLTRDFPSNYAMAQWQPSDHQDAKVIGELFAHFGAEHFTVQTTRTGVPVVWLPPRTAAGCDGLFAQGALPVCDAV